MPSSIPTTINPSPTNPIPPAQTAPVPGEPAVPVEGGAAPAAPAPVAPAVPPVPQPDPVPAPTSVPVVPRTEEPIPEPAQPVSTEPQFSQQQVPQEWTMQPVGDTNYDTALDLVKSAMSPAEAMAAFGAAVDQANPAMINVDLLTEKLGPAQANAVKTLAGNYITQAHSQKTAALDAVHGVAGGKENWDQVTTWANAKAAEDPQFAFKLEIVRNTINQGGNNISYAAKELLGYYNADANNIGLNEGSMDMLTGDTPSQGGPDAGVQQEVNIMTRLQWADEVKKAANSGNDARYAALNRAWANKTGLEGQATLQLN